MRSIKMILELKANSKLNQGYTPDWIRLEIYDEDTRIFYELTMDITGETSYEPNNFQTRTKGWIAPWTFYNGHELLELEHSTKDQIAEYCNLFENMAQQADNIIVGVYPVDDVNYNPEDILTGGVGHYTNADGWSMDFEFECEVNL